MLNVIIVVAGLILLPGLLYFEKKENRKGMVPVKSTLSLLFVVTVLVQHHPIPSYFYLILAGLCFCLGGDVFLALPQKKMFLFGLISFLIGHVFYIFAFVVTTHFNALTVVGIIITVIVSAGDFIWLKPHLGDMKIPVMVYVIVITLMLIGAWSILGDNSLRLSGRIWVFVGAVSFYFSDIFVARDRFMKNEFLNRLIGLPMYYAGQFILAFSVGLLNPNIV